MRPFLLFFPLALFACGGATADGTPSQADTGPHSTTDAGTPSNTTDAAPHSTTDAAPHSTTDAAPHSTADAHFPDAGTLVLQAFGGASGEVAAQIPVFEPGVGVQQTCASPQDAGACQLVSCANGGIGSPSGGYGDFGPVTASIGATSVPITYNGIGYGTVYFPKSVTLGTGGTMTFNGGSGSVPAFDVSATIPGLGVITSPMPTPDGGITSIDTSHDLPVTWTPIAIGTIDFGIQGGDPDPGGTSVTIACTFDGSAGAGTVPAALLSTMKTMAGSSPAYADLSSQRVVTTVVHGLTIVLESYQSSPSTLQSFGVSLE